MVESEKKAAEESECVSSFSESNRLFKNFFRIFYLDISKGLIRTAGKVFFRILQEYVVLFFWDSSEMMYEE